MKVHRAVCPVVALLAVAFATGCETAKSANATGPDVAGPIPGVTIGAPKTLEPAPGQQLTADGTPQTLVLENPGSNGQRELFLQVEVASDGNFQQVLHEATRVTPGENGQTAYRLPDPLAPGHTYYWRARAADGANTGPYSEASHFMVVEPVSLETPTPLEPIGAVATNRPTFVVRNGDVSGPAGDIIYRFEIGTSASAPPAAVVTASPGSGGTTSMSLGDLPWDRTLFWRVWATDGVTDSAPSSIVSFRTPPAPAPSPSPEPPPAGSPSPVPRSGGGGRTPNPPPGQLLPVPGYGASVVQEVAARYPAQLARSCKNNHEWLFLLVHELRKHDTRWGLNWKRGHEGSMSSDIVSYNPTSGPDEGNGQVYIFDVVGAECEGNYPTFHDATGETWAARGDSACAAGTYCTRWTIQPYLRAGFQP